MSGIVPFIIISPQSCLFEVRFFFFINQDDRAAFNRFIFFNNPTSYQTSDVERGGDAYGKRKVNRSVFHKPCRVTPQDVSN